MGERSPKNQAPAKFGPRRMPSLGAVTGGGGGSALPAPWTSEAPEAAAARGERAAERRPPGERQAPGPQPRKGACCDCFEKQTLATFETPSSPISGPQFFKWSSSGTWGGFGRLSPPPGPSLPPQPGEPGLPAGGGGVLAPGAHSPWWVGGYLCTVALTEFP